MKNKYRMIIGFLSIALLISLLHSCRNSNKTAVEKTRKKIEQTSSMVKDKVGKDNNLLKELNLINISGDTVLASEVLQDKKLFFRYSSLNCQLCVDAQFDIFINSSFPNLDNQLSLIAFYQSPRDLLVDHRKLSRHNIRLDMFLSMKSELDLPIESMNVPYYFSLDSKGFVSTIFVPNRDEPHKTIEFLKHVLTTPAKQ